MPMYNLIQYSENYSKTLEVYGTIKEIKHMILIMKLTVSESIKFKVKTTGKTPADGSTIDAKIAALLKYLNNFWRALEISLISCKINRILNRSEKYIITNSTVVGTFKITYKKLYVPLVRLSTQDNAKLLEQSKSELKQTIS